MAITELPPSDPLVTVIVLNYNGVHLLPPCLEALAKQDLPDGKMDVWVVDNDSKDDSLEMLSRDFPWVRVIRNDRNAGFGGGNNVGMRVAKSPYIALTNNDARPEPDWARRLVAPFQAAESDRLGAVSGKIVFLPKFATLSLRSPAFRPGGMDGRELGARVHKVTVDGVDVTEQVLWEAAAYGPEGTGEARFRWTKPTGTILVPITRDGTARDGSSGNSVSAMTLTLAAETKKSVTVEWPDGERVVLDVTENPTEFRLAPPEDTRLVDVLNNTGSIVLTNGYGADRGYQEVDRGQYDLPEEVFAFCGGAVAFRREALLDVGYFDDDFFMYYEDTDLSWRMQSAGWKVLYEPTAVTRHIHAASSVEWSPFFTFHVDLNRLLMLTKNATRDLAVREVLRYPMTTISLALRELARSRHARRRPPVRPTLLRLRVTAAYLRLLRRMFAKRRELDRRAVVGSRELQQRWLLERR
jgi:GT2 family glycosyltransferase